MNSASLDRNRLMFHALEAAEMGFYVFPLRTGTKRPALHSEARCPRTGVCRDGHQKPEQRATTDANVIRQCWAAGPFNIGIATGPSGLVVIDLDTRKSPEDVPPESWSREGVRDGHDVFTIVCANAGQSVPWETRTVRTARGGTHLYFRAPSTVELRNTEGDSGSGLGWKVDTRAHGGYVVAPGSVTPDGEYWPTEDIAPAELPIWLVQALTPKPRPAVSAPVVVDYNRLPSYVTAALKGERDRVAAAQPGTHDKTVFIAGIALGQLVGAGLIPSATAEAHLYSAAAHMISDKCDCTEAKVLRNIQNGIRAGMSRPRRVPGTEPAATTTPLFTERGAA